MDLSDFLEKYDGIYGLGNLIQKSIFFLALIHDPKINLQVAKLVEFSRWCCRIGEEHEESKTFKDVSLYQKLL